MDPTHEHMYMYIFMLPIKIQFFFLKSFVKCLPQTLANLRLVILQLIYFIIQLQLEFSGVFFFCLYQNIIKCLNLRKK